MKKFLTLLLSLIVMCCAVVSMVGCGEDPCKNGHTDADNNLICDVCQAELEEAPHSHEYGSEWKSDATDHWKECSCGEKAEKANHVDNNLDNLCDTCGYDLASDPANPGEPGAPGVGLGGNIEYPGLEH